jgi:acyl carrier protein
MNTHDTIRRFIATELLRGQQNEPLGDDDPLLESGIIDSMGVMSLLAFLEKEFSIQVPGDDLIPENFGSIASIAALVERQKVL